MPTADESGADPTPPVIAGNDAIAAAEERAARTADANIPNLTGLPLPDDTANLRQGPDLHPGLLGLLPLVGVWRGLGEGNDPASGEYHFGQQIVISHDGQNYLNWESRSWVIDDDAQYVGPSLRESGFWRISGPDSDETIEFLVTHAEGWIELFYGSPLNQTSWELVTDVVITSASGTADGRQIGGAKRLYGLVEDGDLAYVEERVDADGDLVPRLSAKLQRHMG
ncbi:FABP family protein [Williamsia sp.]|uniref:FABP family protein n=1 Tax=Williamsia sp. TaxID=1872085 RepID=UPI001A2F1E66|nr:FABP family protein [Williamsia sp.]MBJ7289245.1 FABP family protein [Williamsia sp.]